MPVAMLHYAGTIGITLLQSSVTIFNVISVHAPKVRVMADLLTGAVLEHPPEPANVAALARLTAQNTVAMPLSVRVFAAVDLSIVLVATEALHLGGLPLALVPVRRLKVLVRDGDTPDALPVTPHELPLVGQVPIEPGLLAGTLHLVLDPLARVTDRAVSIVEGALAVAITLAELALVPLAVPLPLNSKAVRFVIFEFAFDHTT